MNEDMENDRKKTKNLWRIKMPKIIKDKCVGCGICANICPEGIEMVNGKAKIKNENIDCLKDAARACPRNCIIIDGNEKGEVNIENIGTGFGRGRGIGGRQGKGGGRGRRSRRKW